MHFCCKHVKPKYTCPKYAMLECMDPTFLNCLLINLRRKGQIAHVLEPTEKYQFYIDVDDGHCLTGDGSDDDNADDDHGDLSYEWKKF